MLRILVVGGASLDILHFDGRSEASIGGAGMYTALAAHRCGVAAGLFAPKPDPVPPTLQPVFDRLSWEGPQVRPSELPRFELAYEAGSTIVIEAFFGAEAQMTPEMMPADLSAFDGVHIVPLGKAGRQLAFLRACRDRGAKQLSAGTFKHIILEDREAMTGVLAESDLFFLNEEEAIALFGSVEAARTEPGKLMYLTLGAGGAWVLQGEDKTHVPAVPAQVLELTGAGDSFAGAVLARLAQGQHPIQAARLAMPLAAQVVTGIGPAALLEDEAPPPPPADERVTVNREQVQRTASLIATLPEMRPFDFTGPEFPAAGQPHTLDFFFASILQQFGFWTTLDGAYDRPMIAPIGGRPRKGSSYLFQAYRRTLDREPRLLSVTGQKNMSRTDFRSMLQTDDGRDVMPAFDLHLTQARAYGRDMVAFGTSPESIMAKAAHSPTPLDTFLRQLDHVGGYKEDPLRKKSTLLALILSQRPEAFLPFGPDEEPAPVIDYHLMRSCLRVGLIDVLDENLAARLAARKVLAPGEEMAIRQAAFWAIEQITTLSGQSMGAVDWFFFNARRRCPEMTEPACDLCALDPLCAHRKELFQPVLRTTFY